MDAPGLRALASLVTQHSARVMKEMIQPGEELPDLYNDVLFRRTAKRLVCTQFHRVRPTRNGKMPAQEGRCLGWGPGSRGQVRMISVVCSFRAFYDQIANNYNIEPNSSDQRKRPGRQVGDYLKEKADEGYNRVRY